LIFAWLSPRPRWGAHTKNGPMSISASQRFPDPQAGLMGTLF